MKKSLVLATLIAAAASPLVARRKNRLLLRHRLPLLPPLRLRLLLLLRPPRLLTLLLLPLLLPRPLLLLTPLLTLPRRPLKTQPPRSNFSLLLKSHLRVAFFRLSFFDGAARRSLAVSCQRLYQSEPSVGLAMPMASSGQSRAWASVCRTRLGWLFCSLRWAATTWRSAGCLSWARAWALAWFSRWPQGPLMRRLRKAG